MTPALQGPQDPPAVSPRDVTSEGEARFRVALQHSGVITFEHDLALRYTWIYPTQFYARDSVLGRTDAELFPEDNAQQLMELKRRVLATGVGTKEEVYVVMNGRRHDYVLTVEPLRDGRGQIVGLTGASTNITSAKQTQNDLARALEFRDLALGILSHDLRNPLSAVHASVQLLLNRQPTEQQRRPLLSLQRSAHRMAELISTLIDFTDSRFNGSLKVAPAACDFADVLRKVVEELLAANPDGKIALTFDGDSVGLWDASRLAQVASNLIGNGLRHGRPGGVVQVALRSEASMVVCTVSNEGPPIPAALLPELFKPFQGKPRQDVSSGRGLGLGLYIADQIVRSHQGSIEVSSTAEQGTVFAVRLPRDGVQSAPLSP